MEIKVINFSFVITILQQKVKDELKNDIEYDNILCIIIV